MLNRPTTKDQKEDALRLEQGLDPEEYYRNVINKANRNQLQMGGIPTRASFAKENNDSEENLNDDDDEDGDSNLVIPGFHSVDALKNEIDRMRNDKIKSIEEIEYHKKRVSYAIVLALFSFVFAIGMVAWKFVEHKPTYDELRQKIINTPNEKPSICQSVYPSIYSKTFDSSVVGEPLILTDYLKDDNLNLIAEGARKAKVDDVLQSEISYTGFLRVNETYNSSLFFWFFPARSKAKDSPLLLWLEGGPGWPTTYATFKVSLLVKTKSIYFISIHIYIYTLILYLYHFRRMVHFSLDGMKVHIFYPINTVGPLITTYYT